jgi:hypothetical protein
MSSHICIFFAFYNLDHIKKSFNSIYVEGVDHFIIENKSENSDEIEKFFKSKNIKGYIQYESNIAQNAVNIFMKDFKNLLLEYEYITYTDGDLYFNNIETAYKESKQNLEEHNTVMTSVSLWQGNYYLRNNKIIGTNPYDEYMDSNDIEIGGTDGNTGAYLWTIKRENLWIFQDVNFIDTRIKDKIKRHNKRWLVANHSLAYHLTWDSYVDGNPYYEWKKTVISGIWKDNKTSKYRKIV